MYKFILNDSDPNNEFSIDYLGDGFIGIKKNLNSSNIEDDIKNFTIYELEDLIGKLKIYIDNDFYRQKDQKIVSEMYNYIYNIRYGK